MPQKCIKNWTKVERNDKDNKLLMAGKRSKYAQTTQSPNSFSFLLFDSKIMIPNKMFTLRQKLKNHNNIVA